MSGRLRVAAVIGGLALAGCSLITPPTEISGSVTSTEQDGDKGFIVRPWPFDATAAFICANEPGPEFTAENPTPAAAAGCLPLRVTAGGGALTALLDTDQFERDDLDTLLAAGPPWFLAVAGGRDGTSATTTIQVIDSPVASPPGPS